MKKLLLFALMTMLISSCSRLVNVDYKVADYGTVTTIHNDKHTLSLYSLKDKKDKKWYLENAQVDYLSFFGLDYDIILAPKDTVYIYQDGASFFASKHSIEDAKSINQALSRYETQTILAQCWPILIIFVLFFMFVAYRIRKCRINLEEGFLYFALTLISLFMFMWMGFKTYGKLDFLQKGKITRITPEYVTLDHSLTAPLASTEDIKTQKPAQIGETVYLYEANNHVFISSQKLNETTLNAWQPYPETWIHILLLFCSILGIAIILTKLLSMF